AQARTKYQTDAELSTVAPPRDPGAATQRGPGAALPCDETPHAGTKEDHSMARARETQAAVEVSEAEIAVHWKEEEYYYPSARFIGQANLTDPSVNELFSLERFPECFREY